jgi:hypothetical protein
MSGPSFWIGGQCEPAIVREIRELLDASAGTPTARELADAGRMLAVLHQLPARYFRSIEAALRSIDVAEDDLEVAALALELAAGREPPILHAIREAQAMVESFSQGLIGRRGGGDAERHGEARREAAALLARCHRLPDAARRVIALHLGRANVDPSELLNAIALLEQEDRPIAA